MSVVPPPTSHDDSIANIPFPCTTRHAAAIIDGVHTEVFITGFTDRIFIVISQFGRIGSLLHVSIDSLAHAGTSISSTSVPPISTSFLLGSSNSTLADLHMLYASQIAQNFVTEAPDERRPLLLGIAIKEYEDDNEKKKRLFDGVKDLIAECRVW